MDYKNNEILAVLEQLKNKTIHLEEENKNLKNENIMLTQHLGDLETESKSNDNEMSKKVLLILYITLIIIVIIQVFVLIFL